MVNAISHDKMSQKKHNEWESKHHIQKHHTDADAAVKIKSNEV